ncbi:hypothetical protein L195_g024746 [Trifolium pratense]|uniref:Uncharacterized protein n=1 Tax=Trifolium pratense TaxID=57577 RepID=A0A2K3NEJ2_TRIPR|nr:hypothetical protein L195_g024746 [Trifolium pratense]
MTTHFHASTAIFTVVVFLLRCRLPLHRRCVFAAFLYTMSPAAVSSTTACPAAASSVVVFSLHFLHSVTCYRVPDHRVSATASPVI